MIFPRNISLRRSLSQCGRTSWALSTASSRPSDRHRAEFPVGEPRSCFSGLSPIPPILSYCAYPFSTESKRAIHRMKFFTCSVHASICCPSSSKRRLGRAPEPNQSSVGCGDTQRAGSRCDRFSSVRFAVFRIENFVVHAMRLRKGFGSLAGFPLLMPCLMFLELSDVILPMIFPVAVIIHVHAAPFGSRPRHAVIRFFKIQRFLPELSEDDGGSAIRRDAITSRLRLFFHRKKGRGGSSYKVRNFCKSFEHKFSPSRHSQLQPRSFLSERFFAQPFCIRGGISGFSRTKTTPRVSPSCVRLRPHAGGA